MDRGGNTFFIPISMILMIAFLPLSGCLGLLERNGDTPATATRTSDIRKNEPSAELPAIREILPERPALTPASAPLKQYQSTEQKSPIREQESRMTEEGYRIGEEDELAISVYGDPDLVKTQTVRPDGKIAFPLIGDIKAIGTTPDELRERITQGISKYVKNPQVTVLVTKYNSKRVSILGEVKTPGLLRLVSDINLLEGISRAGGVTEEADLVGALLVRDGQILPVNFDKLLRQGDSTQNVLLRANDVILIPNIKDKKVFVLGEVKTPLVVPLRPGVSLVESISRAGGVTEEADLVGALLVRDGQILPVNFDKLLRQGDSTQNLLLRANDVILIPNIRDKKVFVLGEVNKPLVVPLRPGVSLVESISMAGGLTRDAESRNVLIVRGGLGDPKLITVNVDAITKKGNIAQNLPLQSGDIVYVPKTLIADVVKFFQDLNTILSPIILTQTGIVLYPAVESVLRTGQTVQAQPIIIGR